MNKNSMTTQYRHHPSNWPEPYRTAYYNGLPEIHRKMAEIDRKARRRTIAFICGMAALCALAIGLFAAFAAAL